MRAKNSGFTTLELSIVMIIFGLIVTTFMGGYIAYNKGVPRRETKEKIDTITSALNEFRSKYGHYPCPADPTASKSNSLYQRERRDNTGSRCLTEIGGTVHNSTRDANNDNIADEVYFGTIPIKSLLDPDNNPATDDGIKYTKLAIEDFTDGWGRQFTYVVSALLVNTSTFNEGFGAIGIVDENGRSMVTPQNSAQFALVSHGQNGKGARNAEGKLIEPCTNSITTPPTRPPPPPITIPARPGRDGLGGHGGIGEESGSLDNASPVIGGGLGGGRTPVTPPPPPPPPVSSLPSETRNCRHSTVLLAGLTSENQNYNDDMVRFMSFSANALWQISGVLQPANVIQVSNTNLGNVGIGVDNPTDKLHIKGNLAATNVYAKEICNTDGQQDCLPPEKIGGNDPAMKCGRNQVMTGVVNGAAVCATAFAAPASGTPCPSGQVLNRIQYNMTNNTTNFLCVTPP